MPADLTGDEIGAPALCPHCTAVIATLSQRDHIDDRESVRVAAQLARQCCSWRKP